MSTWHEGYDLAEITLTQSTVYTLALVIFAMGTGCGIAFACLVINIKYGAWIDACRTFERAHRMDAKK